MLTAMAALLGALLMMPAAAAAAPEKILVLPFTIHAEKDMAFLNQGIVSMLTSRLTKPGQTVTEAASQLPDAPKKIVELARSLGAKYYTTGSLTLFGASVSTDARLIETDTGKTIVAYNQYGERAGDVLAHMDAFARQIDAQLSATAIPKPAAPAPTAPAAAAPAAMIPAAAAGTAATPDAAPRAIAAKPAAPAATARPLPAPGVKMSTPAEAPVVAIATAPAAGAADIPFFESQGFTEEIRSLTTGDIDGDGISEIVFASAGRISVMQFQDGKLIPITGYNTPREYPIITVDAADLNGNGKSELFITRINEMAQSRDPNVRQWGIDSIVVESQNGRLTETATGLKYYFRAIDTPDAGRVVLAQRRSVVVSYGELETVTSRNNTGGLFLGNVFYMAFQNGAYVPGETVLLPGQVSIYDFARGDILNDGSDILTALTGKGYLTLLDVGGKRKWRGKDRYGGSSVYLEYPSIEGTSQMDRYYLRQRLFVVDIDQDNNNEVVLVNNHDFSMSLASRVRLYQNGRIACLSWGERSLMRKWDTEEMSGFIGDLAIADIDGDGQKELIYAVVEKPQDSFSSGKSLIVIQNPPSSK